MEMSEKEEQWCSTAASWVSEKCWGDASKEEAECNSQKLFPIDSRKIVGLA